MTQVYAVLSAILVAILVIWIGRELVCSYLKVNERIALQRETNDLLRIIAKSLEKEREVKERSSVKKERV